MHTQTCTSHTHAHITYMYIHTALQSPDSTVTTMDNHDYYTSQFYPPGPEADGLWVDLNNITEVEDLAHNISELYRYFAVSVNSSSI